MNHAWPWLAFALLGAYHGLNPGMGWLFALSLGLQEKSRSAVLRALLPIAVGHAAAITVAIFLVYFVQQVLPFHAIKWMVAVALLTLGAYRLFRAGHPRGAGMRVGTRDLAVWSFLMASAHGAGLMLVPILLAHPAMAMDHTMTASISQISGIGMRVTLLAVLVHTGALLIVAGLLAITFFELYGKFGLNILRHAWLNFDLLWAIALLIAGCSVLFF